MMKTIHYSLIAVAAALALAPGRAYAFHSGGVAECEGCHTMHNTRSSGRGIPALNGEGQGATYLLQGREQSAARLNPHPRGPHGAVKLPHLDRRLDAGPRQAPGRDDPRRRLRLAEEDVHVQPSRH